MYVWQRRKLLREITDVQKRRQIREEEQLAQEQLRSSKFKSECIICPTLCQPCMWFMPHTYARLVCKYPPSWVFCCLKVYLLFIREEEERLRIAMEHQDWERQEKRFLQRQTVRGSLSRIKDKREKVHATDNFTKWSQSIFSHSLNLKVRVMSWHLLADYRYFREERTRVWQCA